MSGVSVIIPTYNFGRFLSAGIESALGQTCEPVEVIVVDDGSTDDTGQVVRRYETVRYIRQQNSGVCAARNRGVDESSGEYIAFLDADDIWETTKLEKQLAIFKSDSAIGLVHSGMREFESATGETLALRTQGQDGWVADELLLWERPAVNVSGSSIMVRRDAFDAVGGFDTRQKVGEDWDFCYRVARKYKVGFVSEPLVNYRSHSGSAHNNVTEMERGMGLFYEKAFAERDPHVQSLRNRAMSNYHKVLSGSYFHAGSYGPFLKHATLSIAKKPSNLGYFLSFPLRRLSGGSR